MYCLLTAILFTAIPDEVSGLRCSVVTAGDVDDDGVPDFCVARRGVGPLGFGEAAPLGAELGRVWVVSGRDGGLLRSLEAPGDPDFGRVLADLQDLDGDGKGELVVGGKRTWVFSGADGSLLHELAGGVPVGGGDFDGDGTPDLAIKPYGDSLALVYSGKTWELLGVFGTADAPPREEWREGSLFRTLSGSRIRDALAFVPDRDGDGRDELALVLDGALDGGGAALVVLSAVSGKRMLQAALPEGGSEDSPWIVDVLGDMDGDGLSELLLSMVNDFVVLYSGKTGEALRRHSYVGGYLNGEGTSLDVVGDYDLDGVPDYLIAANEDGLDCDPGMVVVVSGESGRELRLVEFEYNEDRSCGPGADACAIGDTNGDGLSEVVLHLPRKRHALVLSGADFVELVTIDLAVAPFRSR